MKLTEEIIKQILSNLGVIYSEFVNINHSIISNEFIINEKLSFELDDGSTLNNKIWACSLPIEKNELKILIGNASQDNLIKEYCAIVHLTDMPIYGLYFIEDSDSQSLIAYSIDSKLWNKCNIYLQATFLAGMEKMKDYIIFPKKCKEYNMEYKAMLSFIKFHSSIFER